MARGIGNNAPRDPISWMGREIHTLKQAVREIRAARTLDASSISSTPGKGIRTENFNGTSFADPGTTGNYFGGDGAVLNQLHVAGTETLEGDFNIEGTGSVNVEGGGGIAIRNGGFVKIVDPTTGNQVAYLGSADTIDGNPQMVVEIYRDDGTIALALGDFGIVPGHPHQQAIQWYDRSGNIVVADDTTSGVGLARPHVPLGMCADTNTTRWPGTNATAFTAIASCYAEIQQPRLSWYYNVYAPAGVTGQFRLVVGGTQVGSTFAVTNNAFGNFTGVAAIPAGIVFGQQVLIELQARVTVGSGTVIAQQLLLNGSGS